MPSLLVVAGPNGSGKSTFTRRIEFQGREHLVDPDAVARDINPTNPSAAAMAAARQSWKRIRELMSGNSSFAVETTLASQSSLKTMAEARSRGYEVHLTFIGLDSVERCIARIRSRAAQGGHFIPEFDVRRRYARSLKNLTLAIRLADTADVYDNSGKGHRIVLVAKAGVVVWTVEPLPRWLELSFLPTE